VKFSTAVWLNSAALMRQIVGETELQFFCQALNVGNFSLGAQCFVKSTPGEIFSPNKKSIEQSFNILPRTRQPHKFNAYSNTATTEHHNKTIPPVFSRLSQEIFC
jgi:hypothetical protein